MLRAIQKNITASTSPLYEDKLQPVASHLIWRLEILSNQEPPLTCRSSQGHLDRDGNTC